LAWRRKISTRSRAGSNTTAFRVNQVYTNRILIDFSGTAGQLREAFHTSIHQLDVDGEQHIANFNDPLIPAALAPVVKGISSLNDFKPRPMYRTKPQYTVAGCTNTTNYPTLPGNGTCYSVTPQDTQTIYGLNPLFAAGITGTGQTIAVVEDTDTYSGTGDWSTYVTTFGLSKLRRNLHSSASRLQRSRYQRGRRRSGP